MRKALGRLDYRYDLDTNKLARICGRGRPGSAALKQAIANYDPRIGRRDHRNDLILRSHGLHVNRYSRELT